MQFGEPVVLEAVTGVVLLRQEINSFFVQACMAGGSFTTYPEALFPAAPGDESFGLSLEPIKLFVGRLDKGGGIKDFAGSHLKEIRGD